MADVITRLKLESGEYDSKVKRATQGLLQMEQECRNAGKSLATLEKEQKQYVQSLGSMQTVSTTVRGKLGELTQAYTELRVQYNRLTEEEKKGDFGKALSSSLDQLNQRIQQTKKELSDVNKELSGMDKLEAGGLFGGSKISGMLQVFGGNVMTKGFEMAAGAVSSMVNEIGDCIKQGVELAKQGEGIRIAFERIGRGDLLDGLRQATHGTITDLELMKAAVRFDDFKLPLDQLGTMLAFAQQKAKDTGQSFDYMVDSIVTGLGRQSPKILDNLGLSITEIHQKTKETGDMTKAVGQIIREQMAKAGDYVETAADRAAQANVSLQNKMEELGRKFAPVEEASNQLWTSMKIGILDIVGGPLAELLNGLTEAGRLQNMLNNLNGEGDNTKVGGQLKKLQAIRKAGGSSYMFNSTLSGMMEDYNRQIMALDAQIKNGGKPIGGGSGSSQDVRYLQRKMDALKIMRDELKKGAQDIQNPKTQNTTTTTTTGPKKGIKEDKDDFTEIIGLIGNAQERVSDLQKQIRESWDQNEITTLNQKLKDAQNELDVLTGKLPKDTTANLKVSIDSDTLHTIEELEDVTFDDKTMTVTANTSEALQKVRELVAEAGGEIIEIKVEPVITDEDIERSLREQYGKPIEVPVVPKTAGEKLEQEVRIKLAQQNIDADMQTLRTLLEAQIKNGIEGIEIPTGFLIEKIMGEGVPDEYWQNLQDQFNEELKKMDIDPINIDFKTGKDEGKKSKGGPMDNTKKVVSGLNQVASGLQQMGIQLPEGVNQVLGVVNGLMTIIQGISAIIGVTQMAAVTANTVAITALTAAVWANTASSFIPFANGGIVGFAKGGLVGKAASGMLVGNHMSGDNLRLPVNGGGMIGVNDGELILNRSQQGVIANALEGGNALQNLQLNAVIKGEQIRLVLNNNGRRTGRGEYVQTNRR